MVQKEAKRRGRPRAYDPDAALRRARDTFWEAGYSATSLDDLGAAMSMNRPSLYAAFGDKEALYLQTLERYRVRTRDAMREIFSVERPLVHALRELYTRALKIYFPDDGPARGCFFSGTAAAEAVHNPRIREVLNASQTDIDTALIAAFRRASRAGELKPDADPIVLAKMAAALLHTIALRARSGEPRRALKKLTDDAVELICSGA